MFFLQRLAAAHAPSAARRTFEGCPVTRAKIVAAILSTGGGRGSRGSRGVLHRPDGTATGGGAGAVYLNACVSFRHNLGVNVNGVDNLNVLPFSATATSPKMPIKRGLTVQNGHFDRIFKQLAVKVTGACATNRGLFKHFGQGPIWLTRPRIALPRGSPGPRHGRTFTTSREPLQGGVVRVVKVQPFVLAKKPGQSRGAFTSPRDCPETLDFAPDHH